MNIFQYIAPKATDKPYTAKINRAISLILRADSYKFAHPFAYRVGIQAMTSYGTTRVNAAMQIVNAGGQYLVQKYFSQQITMQDIDDAEQFSIAHFGRKLFSRADWEAVVNEYNGFMPITIRSLPEGTVGHGQLCQYNVSAQGRFFWMSSFFETVIQRGYWYPSTVATQDYTLIQDITRFYVESGSDMMNLRFALHDFGGRGVSCGEQAEIGGAAHLYNFMGSDTIEGIVNFNRQFNSLMGAFSVYATEHSVECSFGLDNEGERQYLLKQISNGGPGIIISIVIDGRDWERCAKNLCYDPEIKAAILASGSRIVFRPDSGEMLEIVPQILKMQQDAYGYDEVIGVNGRIYRRTRTVGMIWGDGVDHNAIRTMLGNLVAMGYTADCMIFGSGGALLQKVNRDTFKWAQKASSIMVDGKWIGIAKDPISDPGKKSQEGFLTAIRHDGTGELKNFDLTTGDIPDGWSDAHILIYSNGTIYNEQDSVQIRNRLNW